MNREEMADIYDKYNNSLYRMEVIEYNKDERTCKVHTLIRNDDIDGAIDVTADIKFDDSSEEGIGDVSSIEIKHIDGDPTNCIRRY